MRKCIFKIVLVISLFTVPVFAQFGAVNGLLVDIYIV